MTEILTESFCERCGTRYTFESARPRTRLKGVKVLSRGLKNFVLSDDTSIDEAMASARSESDREASAHQLDAFHKTFNFCMSCRQYTCPNCWNEAEARCLSCAPLALPEVSHEIHDLHQLRDAVLIGDAASANGAAASDTAAEAWSPVSAGPFDDEAPAPDDGGFEMDAIDIAARLSAAPLAEPGETPVEGDSDAVAAADADLAIEPDDQAGKAASQTLGLLRRFRPGQSLDDELDAFERDRNVATPADAPSGSGSPTDDLAALQAERIAAAATQAAPETVEAEAAFETTPDDQIEEPALEADEAWAPVAAEASEPVVEPATPSEAPAAPPLAAAAASDVVEQPTWRITAPDPTATPPAAPTADPGAPARPAGGEPQWPAKPEWPSASAAAGLPFLGRPATPQGGIDALWAASNQELATAAPAAGKAASGIQPCISCGLSLSATARFCRRCGTLQGR